MRITSKIVAVMIALSVSSADRDEGIGDKLRVFDLSSGKELWSFAASCPGGPSCKIR